MVINLFKKKSSVPVITLIIPHFDIAFFGFIQKCNISVFSKEIYILSEHTSISGFIERKHFFLPQWHQRICKVHLIVEHFFCYILCLWIILLAVIIGEYIFLSFFFFCFLFFWVFLCFFWFFSWWWQWRTGVLLILYNCFCPTKTLYLFTRYLLMLFIYFYTFLNFQNDNLSSVD